VTATDLPVRRDRPAPARPRRVGVTWDYYRTIARLSVIQQLQYRGPNYFYMIGMITEPVVYLVVWSTVARAQGGSVGGFTPGEFAAYYIVWTLVRNMNIVLTPYAWEERIREGRMAGELLRPLHPIHHDIAFFAGWKVAVIAMWLPIGGLLVLLFRPSSDVTPLEVAVFAVAIWGAYLVRTMFMWVLGLLTFWTTRVGALFEVWFTAELLLSGRLVPLSLMPDWVRTVGAFTPFPSSFGFPIDALVGDLSTGELLGGLATQALWIAIGLLVVALTWRFAVRRFSSVGN
jgi:viologen exporter family transport system permease protein